MSSNCYKKNNKCAFRSYCELAILRFFQHATTEEKWPYKALDGHDFTTVASDGIISFCYLSLSAIYSKVLGRKD
uniref:Uncharacterized protein MANES_03G022000 n=1 Tax=Rhizophora mucronata TaxID=61149 RepID=A0A2P2LKF2_RHIMU